MKVRKIDIKLLAEAGLVTLEKIEDDKKRVIPHDNDIQKGILDEKAFNNSVYPLPHNPLLFR